MKALTISQPFAFLIADGQKPVENRSWPTSYRGPLAIHAGQGTQYLTKTELKNYTTGAIVATCDLVTCIEVDNPSEKQRQELDAAGIGLDDILNHKHCEGPWAWVLTEIRPCDPVPITGKQGLWDVPDSLVRSAIDELAF